MVRHPLSRIAACVLAVGVVACGDRAAQHEEDTPVSQTIAGACDEAFGAEVCSWGTMVGNDVTEFGVTIPMATINGAPADAPMVFPPPFEAIVPLPASVVTATGFSHMGLNWEPHGHPPAVFMAPHFDFHFYTITPEQVDAIDCADLNKPAATPAGYTLPDMEIPGMGTLVGLCVPKMGMHAVLETELAETETFDASMIVGYYGQDLIFVEPMIAQATLQRAESFTMAMPEMSSGDVAVPTRFEAVYDSTAAAYRFVFSDLPTE